jgi:hypothetical protein
MNRIDLAFACRRDNSSGEEFAHHLKLPDCAKFIARSVKGFAHRGGFFRSKRATFCGRIDWHCALPLTARRLNLSDEQWRSSSPMPALSTALPLLLARYVLSASFC